MYSEAWSPWLLANNCSNTENLFLLHPVSRCICTATIPLNNTAVSYWNPASVRSRPRSAVCSTETMTCSLTICRVNICFVFYWNFSTLLHDTSNVRTSSLLLLLLSVQGVFLPLVSYFASLVSACHLIGMSHMDGYYQRGAGCYSTSWLVQLPCFISSLNLSSWTFIEVRL